MGGFFKQLPKADFHLTAEETNALYERVRSGDKQAADLMITGNIRQVVQCVKKYSQLQDSTKNELVQVALYTLVRCVNKIAKGRETPNCFGYIRFCVKRQLLEIFREKKEILFKDFDKSGVDNLGYIDLMDSVELALLTDGDRLVFNLLSQGYNQEEIGKRMGLGKARINQIIKGIRERLNWEIGNGERGLARRVQPTVQKPTD